MTKTKEEQEKGLMGPIFGFIAGIAATSFTFVSGVLDREVDDRKVDVEVMRIAFDVLQLSPEQTGSTYRTWACEVLNAHTVPVLDCQADDANDAILSSQPVLPQFTVGSRNVGSADLTDISIFICDDSDEQSAQIAASQLRLSGFGDITLDRWTSFDEISRSELSGKTSVIFDADHPERNEVGRVVEAISAMNFQRVVSLENRGAKTEWLISVVFCDVDGT